MSIGWGLLDIIAAGIPAYFLYALILQFFDLNRNRFRELGISQLLIDPIAKTDVSKIVKAKLPEIINLPIYPIILTLVLGFFSYTIIDAVVDELDFINILPNDESTIKKVYKDKKDFVISSDYHSSPIKKIVLQLENKDSCEENICVEIYRYQRRFLQLKDYYYNTGCAAIRSGVRFSREMFIYFLIAFLLFFARFIRPYKIEDNKESKPKKILWYQWLATRKGALCGLTFSSIFMVISIVVWSNFNRFYYTLIIQTYNLLPYINSSVN